jgi:hypothetical protein
VGEIGLGVGSGNGLGGGQPVGGAFLQETCGLLVSCVVGFWFHVSFLVYSGVGKCIL